MASGFSRCSEGSVFAPKRCFLISLIVPPVARTKKAEYLELGECYKRGEASGLADVTNALYENAMSGNLVSQIFFLKKRDPNRCNAR